MDESMRNVVLMFSGIMLFGGVIALLDWLGRRKERQGKSQ
jgi:hypothetical protein